MASPALKAWYAAQEPDPLAVILGGLCPNCERLFQEKEGS